jgi:drug/metabolite transporter (DMT)-like permease
MSPRLAGYAAAAVTIAIWTCFIVIARASAQRTLGPFDLALARIVGASLVLIPWGWWLVRQGGGRQPRSLFGLSPLSLRLTALTGSFGGLGYALLVYSGFFYAPATHAAVLLPGSLPLWTTLLAALLLHDRITPARAVGLVLILAGDLLVGGASLLRAFDGGEVWKGDLLFMGAALCWAVYTVLARRHGIDPVKSTIAITVFAFCTYVPAYALLTASDLLPSRLSRAAPSEVVFHMLFQGLGSVVISGMTFMKMIQYFGPVRSTMMTAVVPGLSALGAVLLLDEPLHWNLLAGLALVTAGIVFGVRRAVAPGPAPALHPAGATATCAKGP